MRVCILGRNGFIGKALWEKYTELGVELFSYPRRDADVIYWFASPSSQILFKYAPEYCFNETVMGFKNILNFCAQNTIKLIYPSTASTSNEYANCKLTLEGLQHLNPYKNVLGIRITAGYGYEEHKGEYASIVYQFCKLMKEGKRPIIFGDGTQTRDFIYIDDLSEQIINRSGETGVIKIGTGINTSFNDVVRIINEELKTDIEPIYIDRPDTYLQDAKCSTPSQIKYSLREGIKEICQKLS